MKDIKIFACNSAEEFTKEICDTLGLPLGQKEAFKFANDNNFVQLKETVRDQDVFIVQTTKPPVNERIMELLITIEAVRRASAARINVVLPYFMYSRSDKKDQARIPVTAKLMATLLEAAGADRIITCDLHNPAIQAYFDINCDRLTAKHLLERYFKNKNLKDIVVVATDAGSSKKAYKYSHFFDCPLALIDKRREDNNDKAVATNIIGDIEGKTALTNFNSFFSPTNGIIISGTISYPSSSLTSIAASINALVCILAISGYVTAKRHPLCPIIGLNSCSSVHFSFKCSTVTPMSLASCLISSSSVGKNSCRGGSK